MPNEEKTKDQKTQENQPINNPEKQDPLTIMISQLHELLLILGISLYKEKRNIRKLSELLGLPQGTVSTILNAASFIIRNDSKAEQNISALIQNLANDPDKQLPKNIKVNFLVAAKMESIRGQIPDFTYSEIFKRVMAEKMDIKELEKIINEKKKES